MSLANVLAMSRRARARSCCSAIRSSSTSRSRARIRPAPTDRRSRTCSATHDDHARPTSASSSSTPGGSTRTSPSSRRRCSTRASCESRENLGAASALHGPAPLAGAGVRLPVRRARRQPTTESAEEARQVAAVVARPASRADRRWTDKHGEEHARRLRGHPRRRAVQRPGRSHRAALSCRGGARRHRRQVPGPGGADQHLLDDHLLARGCAARHELPLLAEPPQRGDLARRCVAVVVAAPALLRVRGRTPEQMRLANALCQFAEMATAT